MKKILNPTFIRTIFFIAIFSLYGHLAIGQVHIAPTAVYLNNKKSSGQITLHNSSDDPQKINIELLYGYPDTDEEGKVFLNIFENFTDEDPSAVKFARIYPREVMLPPGEQQTIRFVVRPPSHLKPGEYWARPAISSSPVKGNNSDQSQGIQTRFNLIQRTILSLNYRRGNVQTGIEVHNLEAKQAEDNSVSLFADLKRIGNAAYIGHAYVQVSQSGKVVHEEKREIAVYNDQFRKFTLEKKLTPGTYQLSLTINTNERHEEESEILPANSVTKSATIKIE
ncbi:MAG: hypothetical protein WD059_08875 [Balneolaceae bacterium]